MSVKMLEKYKSSKRRSKDLEQPRELMKQNIQKKSTKSIRNHKEKMKKKISNLKSPNPK